MEALLNTTLPEIPLFRQGKVRDIFEAGEQLVIVSSDRISAFDVIMNEGIPGKGIVLNLISAFWFQKTAHIIPNHMVSTAVEDFPQAYKQYEQQLRGRSMLVKRGSIVPIECIVRGYITGSGWKEYQQTGEVCGIALPEGLVESQKLPEPVFTPSTKAEIGGHDENISFDKAAETAGTELMNQIKAVSLEIYNTCAAYAESKGIIIADTKMEFALDEHGELFLADELLTPDSSRFWPADEYEPGRTQNSFDKQILRNYLLSIDFNKQPPPPKLPENIIGKTGRKYREVYSKLTGKDVAV